MFTDVVFVVEIEAARDALLVLTVVCKPSIRVASDAELVVKTEFKVVIDEFKDEDAE